MDTILDRRLVYQDLMDSVHESLCDGAGLPYDTADVRSLIAECSGH